MVAIIIISIPNVTYLTKSFLLVCEALYCIERNRSWKYIYIACICTYPFVTNLLLLLLLY